MRPLRYFMVTYARLMVSKLFSLSKSTVVVTGPNQINKKEKRKKGPTYSFVLLVEIENVEVENLDKQLNAGGRLHARVGNAQGALQTLEHSLAVAVQLLFLIG